MRAGFVPYAVLFPPFLTPFLLLDVWQIASLAVETCRQIDRHTLTPAGRRPASLGRDAREKARQHWGGK
ncbi:hypothetical protein LZ31DRAFT_550138 [Colletotrichum somersetense]|nr:hypothetical protein LZ31DRAFT_550138 [Colletotrichum somersetense]